MLKQFNGENVKIRVFFVCSNILTKQTDVCDIKFVINIDYPNQTEDYIVRERRAHGHVARSRWLSQCHATKSRCFLFFHLSHPTLSAVNSHISSSSFCSNKGSYGGYGGSSSRLQLVVVARRLQLWWRRR